MKSFSNDSSLIFFKTEKYRYIFSNIFDASSCPRPHYCIGLILSGKVVFEDVSNGEKLFLSEGDIIFVPMGSRYISRWESDNEICYISMHFVFENSEIFPQKNNYRFAKIHVPNFEEMKKIFESSLSVKTADNSQKLRILGDFYKILSEMEPSLSKKEISAGDPRFDSVIEYIEKNYSQKINVESLAAKAHLSISRFFPYFKKQFGITPIDYINNYRISRSVILLMNDDSLSIEEISERVGFESSAYFRRVFKKVTGHTPREYKKISTEL